MKDEPVVVEDNSSLETVPAGRTTAQWIQLPRRLLFLVVAYVLARLLLVLIPALLPDPVEEGRVPYDLIGERLVYSLQLLATAFCLALILAALPILLGVLADRMEKRQGFPGSLLKGVGRLVVFPIGSLPVVISATLLLLLLLQLEIDQQPETVLLPALALALYPAMILAQATTKALTIPAPLPPVRRIGGVVLMALANLFAQTAGLLSMGMVVEYIFNWNGLGRLLLQSFFVFDFSVTLAALVTFLALVFWGRLLAEVFSAVARLLIGDNLPTTVEPSLWRKKARLIWVVFALALLLLPAGVAATGLIIPSERTVEQELNNRYDAPSLEHPFGTDDFGRDVFARVFKGAWHLIALSILSTIAVLFLAVPLGMLTGYMQNRRSWLWESLSDAVLLLFDVWLVFPLLPLMIVAVVALGFVGQGGITALVMALFLLPRGIRAGRQLWWARGEGQNQLVRVGFLMVALFLGLLFTSFSALLALDILGFLTARPFASLGTNLQVGDRWSIYFNWLIIFCLSFPIYLAADAFIGFFQTKAIMVRLNE